MNENSISTHNNGGYYEDEKVVESFKNIRNDFFIILIFHIFFIVYNYYYGEYYELIFIANIVYSFVYFIGLLFVIKKKKIGVLLAIFSSITLFCSIEVIEIILGIILLFHCDKLARASKNFYANQKK